MISCLTECGRVGLTAVADSPEDARQMYDEAQAVRAGEIDRRRRVDMRRIEPRQAQITTPDAEAQLRAAEDDGLGAAIGGQRGDPLVIDGTAFALCGLQLMRSLRRNVSFLSILFAES